MCQEINDYIKACERCQRNSDKSLKPQTPLHPIPIPNEVWQQVMLLYYVHLYTLDYDFICSKLGIDVIKMSKTLRGNCYIVTCIDHFSKWPEAVALQDKSAASVAKLKPFIGMQII